MPEVLPISPREISIATRSVLQRVNLQCNSQKSILLFTPLKPFFPRRLSLEKIFRSHVMHICRTARKKTKTQASNRKQFQNDKRQNQNALLQAPPCVVLPFAACRLFII
jgi:hypothetical protein